MSQSQKIYFVLTGLIIVLLIGSAAFFFDVPQAEGGAYRLFHSCETDADCSDIGNQWICWGETQALCTPYCAFGTCRVNFYARGTCAQVEDCDEIGRQNSYWISGLDQCCGYEHCTGRGRHYENWSCDESKGGCYKVSEHNYDDCCHDSPIFMDCTCRVEKGFCGVECVNDSDCPSDYCEGNVIHRFWCDNSDAGVGDATYQCAGYTSACTGEKWNTIRTYTECKGRKTCTYHVQEKLEQYCTAGAGTGCAWRSTGKTRTVDAGCVCKKGACGAQCDTDGDCGNSCSKTYHDYCDGTKLVEYDLDRVKDSTIVSDSCSGGCLSNCTCAGGGRCSVDCSPPSTNTYCVAGVCGAECDSDDDCGPEEICDSDCTCVPSGACVDHNVWGWAWSENVGWISFSCENQGAPVDYGVDINKSTGVLSGYAWSENVGWISFNSVDLSGCPSGTCEAKVDLDTGKVSGWAKALSGGAPEAGGWDGWIKLEDTDYGAWIDSSTSPSEFRDWAWGSDVVGWLSFNCQNQGVCATSDYKVVTSLPLVFNQPPTAAISCDIVDCKGPGCKCVGTWATYNGPGVVYTIRNESTDSDGSISQSNWFVEDPAGTKVFSNTCSGKCDMTVPRTLEADDYTVKLKVEDDQGETDTTSHSLKVKQDAVADFECSLDEENWQDCTTIEPAQDETVYFKDSSQPSGGATGIDSRTWKLNGNVFDSDNNTNPSVSLTEESNIVELTIEDSAGRTDTISYDISAGMPVPWWREIIPF